MGGEVGEFVRVVNVLQSPPKIEMFQEIKHNDSKQNFDGSSFIKMVGQTEYTHELASAQRPALFNFQFMRYTYQTS